MEQENKTSLWLYEQLRQTAARSGAELTVAEVKQLLAQMERELLIDGCSPLFSAAAEMCPPKGIFKILSRKFAPKSFTLNAVQEKIPAYDAYILVSGLAEHMRGGDTEPQLAEALPYFFGNQPRKPADVAATFLKEMLQAIDQAVPQRRMELLVPGAQAADDQKEKTAAGEGVCEASTGLADSNIQDSIVSNAREQADRIIADADALAAHKIAAADQRVMELIQTERLQHSQSALRIYSEGIYEIQNTLQQIGSHLKEVGNQTRRLDAFIAEESIRKAHINLIELYNLIADTRDSQMNRVKDTQDEDLKNSVFNLDVFLDMIAEYLADYGIAAISTEPGAAFNATNHAVPRTMKDYHPQSLVVGKSVRKGFIWGDQVLQKEQVEVQ